MLRDGHFGIGLLCAAPIAGGAVIAEQPLVGAVATVMLLFGSGIPDVDTSIPFVTHRGILHTLWFGIGVGGITIAVSFGAITGLMATNSIAQELLAGQKAILAGAAGLGATCGVLSHLLGDMITPWGITPLEPISDRKIRYELTTASNTTANTLLLLFGGGAFLSSIVVAGYLAIV